MDEMDCKETSVSTFNSDCHARGGGHPEKVRKSVESHSHHRKFEKDMLSFTFELSNTMMGAVEALLIPKFRDSYG